MAEQKFEEAMLRLEKIVLSLESGELPLEKAIEVFEEGMGLMKFCSSKLEEAEKKVSILVRESGEKYKTVPFESDEETDMDGAS